MKQAGMATAAVGLAGLILALVMGVLWHQERTARRDCEALHREASRDQAQAQAKIDEMGRTLEQERELRRQREQRLQEAETTGRKERGELVTELETLRREREALAQQFEQLNATRRHLVQELTNATAALETVQQERDGLAGQLESVRASMPSPAAEEPLRQELAVCQAALREANRTLQDQEDASVRRQQALEASMTALQSQMESGMAGQVEVQRTPEEVNISILGEVLFSSGSRRLRPQGRVLLEKTAAALRELPDDAVIQVIGHTDAVPIMPEMRWLFGTNLELSVARAAAVASFLPRAAGLDPARFYAIGRGEHDPVADNETPEGRARNRRVVIRILHAERACEWMGGSTVQ